MQSRMTTKSTLIPVPKTNRTELCPAAMANRLPLNLPTAQLQLISRASANERDVRDPPERETCRQSVLYSIYMLVSEKESRRRRRRMLQDTCAGCSDRRVNRFCTIGQCSLGLFLHFCTMSSFFCVFVPGISLGSLERFVALKKYNQYTLFLLEWFWSLDVLHPRSWCG